MADALPPRRRGFIDGVWVSSHVSGLQLVRGTRGRLLVALGLVPTLVIILSNYAPFGPMQGALGFATALSYQRVVMGLVCLFLGCAALGEEIEGGTLPYLLVRAIPRSALVFGRYLSFVVCAMVLLLPALVGSYVAAILPLGREAMVADLRYLGAAVAATSLGVAAYGGVFVLLSVLVRRALLVGIGLLFAWEAWVVVVPRPLSDYTVLHHVYVLLFHWTDLPVFYEAASWRDAEDYQTAGHSAGVLLSIAAVSLVLAAWRFRSKES